MAKPGLYSNIAAKKKRIAAGSNERMRKPGTKGAPTDKAFKQSAKTAKKKQEFLWQKIKSTIYLVVKNTRGQRIKLKEN